MVKSRSMVLMVFFLGTMLHGCAAPKVDFAALSKPARAAQLDAYDVFVGSWDWTAEVLNADAPDNTWTGTARWEWTLDERCLLGSISARSTNAEFQAEGIWSWHPQSRKYVWWMFNNWGYPQEGHASYDAAEKLWTMKYKSIGLDGTTSYGLYKITVVNHDTLDWRLVEWADAFHLIKKMEMTGSYKRTR